MYIASLRILRLAVFKLLVNDASNFACYLSSDGQRSREEDDPNLAVLLILTEVSLVGPRLGSLISHLVMEIITAIV